LFFAQSLTFLKDCKWRQQTAIFSFDASSPNIFGITVENMVYYKDSNPFMVHMLLLWFSGWYSFYRFIRLDCLWFESLTFVAMHVEILPTIRPIWSARLHNRLEMPTYTAKEGASSP
jgi:hypothetical protein